MNKRKRICKAPISAGVPTGGSLRKFLLVLLLVLLPTPGVLSQPEGGGFAGAETCRTCHAGPFQQWQGTGHAAAFDHLQPAERNDAACLRCHTTGFGRPGGFDPWKQEPAFLRGVQCEACHGPRGDHIGAMERKEEPALPCSPCDYGRTCLPCHTPDADPDFKAHDALKKVGHKDKAGSKGQEGRAAGENADITNPGREASATNPSTTGTPRP